jgi:hypothetical protein
MLVRYSNRSIATQVGYLLFAAVFAVLMAVTMRAQIVETGIITGVVRDNSGAVIQNAAVTVRNSQTGLTSKLSTDAQGIYVSPPLHPGDYTVEIDVAGFSKVVEKVRLEVGQRAGADISLAVGTAAETIEVQDTGTVLQTESSSVGNLRTEEAVRDLPLNGRNFNELFSLGAGVIPTTTQSVSIPYTQQRGPSYFAINGSRPQENRTLLDGIGDQENHNSMTALFPPIDAIQEFSEETHDADARYGRGNGGTINAVIKSGTEPLSRRRLRVSAQHRSGRQKRFQYSKSGTDRTERLLCGKTNLASPSADRSFTSRPIPRPSSLPTMPESASLRARRMWRAYRLSMSHRRAMTSPRIRRKSRTLQLMLRIPIILSQSPIR